MCDKNCALCDQQFVLFDPNGDPAACVCDGVVRINWSGVEDLASYTADPSSRASGIAKLMLAIREQSSGGRASGRSLRT